MSERPWSDGIQRVLDQAPWRRMSATPNRGFIRTDFEGTCPIEATWPASVFGGAWEIGRRNGLTEDEVNEIVGAADNSREWAGTVNEALRAEMLRRMAEYKR